MLRTLVILFLSSVMTIAFCPQQAGKQKRITDTSGHLLQPHINNDDPNPANPHASLTFLTINSSKLVNRPGTAALVSLTNLSVSAP